MQIGQETANPLVTEEFVKPEDSFWPFKEATGSTNGILLFCNQRYAYNFNSVTSHGPDLNFEPISTQRSHFNPSPHTQEGLSLSIFERWRELLHQFNKLNMLNSKQDQNRYET